jgi:phosphoribosyl-AMP cyclohydrolase
MTEKVDLPIKFDERGLAPAVVQDDETGQVLMLAYMNREALEYTLHTGQAHFWSRSRQELWHKGGTSGNVQHVVDLRVDCDADALLLRVRPAGPACHTGKTSCFYRSWKDGTLEEIE